MAKGESVTFIRPGKGYRITCIMPCVLEKGRKMAEADLSLKKTSKALFLLEKKFKGIKLYPEIHAAHIEHEGKRVVIFEKKGGLHLKIMRAKNTEDVIKTVEMISSVINYEYE